MLHQGVITLHVCLIVAETRPSTHDRVKQICEEESWRGEKSSASRPRGVEVFFKKKKKN